MVTIVALYSDYKDEINNFLSKFYNTSLNISETLKWEKKFDNPVEMADIIGVFIDNKDSFKINMWISIDKNLYINITEYNANDIIRYLYERFPY